MIDFSLVDLATNDRSPWWVWVCVCDNHPCPHSWMGGISEKVLPSTTFASVDLLNLQIFLGPSRWLHGVTKSPTQLSGWATKGGSVVANPGNARHLGSIPGSGRCPGEGNGHPSLPGKVSKAAGVSETGWLFKARGLPVMIFYPKEAVLIVQNNNLIITKIIFQKRKRVSFENMKISMLISPLVLLCQSKFVFLKNSSLCPVHFLLRVLFFFFYQALLHM